MTVSRHTHECHDSRHNHDNRHIPESRHNHDNRHIPESRHYHDSMLSRHTHDGTHDSYKNQKTISFLKLLLLPVECRRGQKFNFHYELRT